MLKRVSNNVDPYYDRSMQNLVTDINEVFVSMSENLHPRPYPESLVKQELSIELIIPVDKMERQLLQTKLHNSGPDPQLNPKGNS